jgi:hypothetical protein
VTSSLVLFGVSAACGARTGLPTGSETCTGTPVGQIRQVPNLYFVLDRSNSMNNGTPQKWGVVRNDVAQLITTLGRDARFGAAWFPLSAAEPCSAGVPVMDLRLGDGLPRTQPGSTANVFFTDTDSDPVGGTPTAATFRALTPKLTRLKGHTFAILATDGGPNCNVTLTCGEDQCTRNIDMDGSCDMVDCVPGGPINCCTAACGRSSTINNCLDATDTVDAVHALAEKGVPTYVIGIPGSEAYSTALDEVAVAGLTERATKPFYYPVDTSSSNSLVDAFANIAARIAASCEIELKHAPSAGNTNVVVDGRIVPKDGIAGWSVKGSIVTLFGATCDQVKQEGQKVVVTEGCPTKLD